MKKITLIILLTVFAGCALANTSFNDVKKFREGNRLLLGGNTSGALNIYNQLLAADVKSPELYCNTAFAYYKDKKYGKSIAWYQKALLLAPRDQQLLYDKGIVETTLNKNASNNKTLLISPSWRSVITADNLLIISTALLTLAGLLFIFNLTDVLPRYKKAFKNAGMMLFIVPCITFILSCGFLVYNQRQSHAVITSKTALVRVGPSVLAKKIAELNEGDYIETKTRYNGWLKIDLENKSTGWVYIKDVETIE